MGGSFRDKGAACHRPPHARDGNGKPVILESQKAIVYNVAVTKEEYREYLGGDRWASFKARYYSRHPKRCAICAGVPGPRFKDPIDLHHLTYDRVGEELDSDVVPLCRRHHQAVHDGLFTVRVIGWKEWKRSG